MHCSQRDILVDAILLQTWPKPCTRIGFLSVTFALENQCGVFFTESLRLENRTNRLLSILHVWKLARQVISFARVHRSVETGYHNFTLRFGFFDDFSSVIPNGKNTLFELPKFFIPTNFHTFIRMSVNETRNNIISYRYLYPCTLYTVQ